MRNGVMMQYFEWYMPPGMTWKKIAQEAGSLASLGVRALWIPPAYKGIGGADEVGYAVYDLYDLGEFNQKGSVATKYGTREELAAAVEAAHAQGMQVYADVVLDHRMGADGMETVKAEEYNPDNRLEKESGPQEIEAATLYTFPGRHGEYSDFVWHWYHFTGIDWDDSSKSEGIFKFMGKYWEKQVDKENGNYDYLMGASLDLNHPEVREELKRWGIWFVTQTGVDGFRLDAVKHMKFTFYKEWLHTLRDHFKREFFTVGEYWSKHLSALLNYLETTEDALSLFDVPLHYHLYWASLGGDSFDLRTLFDDTLTAANPVKSVTFVDNHDSQPGQSLESWIRDWFKPHAYALILLREAGYPCIFYGDFYGIDHDGIASKAPMLIPLLEARQRYAYGPQRDYFDDGNLIGWTREGDAEHEGSGLAALVCNGDGGRKRMAVGPAHAGKEYIDITGNSREKVVVAADGTGVFPVGPKSVSVWVRKDAASRDLPPDLLAREPVRAETPSPRDDIRLLRAAAAEAHQSGDAKHEAVILDLALLRARELDDPILEAELLATRGEYALADGQQSEAIACFERALAGLDASNSRDERLRAAVSENLDRARN